MLNKRKCSCAGVCTRDYLAAITDSSARKREPGYYLYIATNWICASILNISYWLDPLLFFSKCYISSGHGWWWSFTYSSVLLSKLKCLLWKNEVVFSPRMVGLSGLNRQVEPAIYWSLYLEFPIFQTKLKSKVIELILHCSLTKNWWNCKVDELDVSRIWTLHHVQLFDLISVTTSACPKTKK